MVFVGKIFPTKCPNSQQVNWSYEGGGEPAWLQTCIDG